MTSDVLQVTPSGVSVGNYIVIATRYSTNL
jgi:hypothetical protein